MVTLRLVLQICWSFFYIDHCSISKKNVSVLIKLCLSHIIGNDSSSEKNNTLNLCQNWPSDPVFMEAPRYKITTAIKRCLEDANP